VDYRGLSLDAKSDCHRIRKNTGVPNFQTEVVGHNQISAVFVPEYERVINIHGYDRICRYYLEPGDYDTDDEAELLEENFGNNDENEDGF
jgi:hypothetical protein